MGRFKGIAAELNQNLGHKFDWRHSTTATTGLGLLASLSLGLWPVGAASATTAQTAPQTTAQTTGYTLSQSLSWGDIVDWLSRRKVAGGSRGEFLCPIAPDFNEQVWSLQPSVFWQGEIAAIGLRRVGDEQPLWKQTLTGPSSNLNHLRYGGRILQPGQAYEWMFFRTADSTQATEVRGFQIMKAVDRDKVRLALLKLPGQGEALTQARVAYFSDQELGADALAEMIALPRPSAELQQILKTLPDRLCKSE